MSQHLLHFAEISFLSEFSSSLNINFVLRHRDRLVAPHMAWPLWRCRATANASQNLSSPEFQIKQLKVIRAGALV